VQVVVGANSTNTFTAQATDGAGNVSSCTTPFSYTCEFLEEICDGIDNDGNGQVEEGLPLFYADADLDGLGDPERPFILDHEGSIA